MTTESESRAHDATVEERRQQRRRAREQAYEQATGRPFTTITIDDPRGIRALAHSARQQVIEVLYAQPESYTSTQLAAMTGLSPSAMSYHLRALEKWGVVERVVDEGDARIRPWRAAGSAIHIRGRGVAGRAASDLWTESAFDAWRHRLEHLRTLTDRERELFLGLGQEQLWLDDDQLEQLVQLADTFRLNLMAQGWRNEPAPGRRRIGVLFSVLPEPPPESSSSRA